MAATFQGMISALQAFWEEQGCVIVQPYHTEVGAGTSNPATFLRVLGPEPWRAAYVEPSIRPDDGRYGENPYRFQQHYQYQVHPEARARRRAGPVPRLARARSGSTRASTTCGSSRTTGRAPTLGAWGLGLGGVDGRDGDHPVHLLPAGRRHRPRPGVGRDHLRPRAARDVPAGRPPRPRHGVGRRASRWADVYARQASASSRPTTTSWPTPTMLARHFDDHEAEAGRCLEAGLPLPAYDHVLKCSHAFNLLDSRRAIAVTDRAAYILRMRRLTQAVAAAHSSRRRPPAMPDLLVEIGCEELPAAHCRDRRGRASRAARRRARAGRDRRPSGWACTSRPGGSRSIATGLPERARGRAARGARPARRRPRTGPGGVRAKARD